MGCYINPSTETKEMWLNKNAKKIDRNTFLSFDFDEAKNRGQFAIVLADNGPFTAAAVMNSKQELNDWQEQDKTDTRPLFYFFAPIGKLAEVSG